MQLPEHSKLLHIFKKSENKRTHLVESIGKFFRERVSLLLQAVNSFLDEDFDFGLGIVPSQVFGVFSFETWAFGLVK